MPIFQISNSKLTPIGKKQIDLEKDLQTLTENNLQAIFGLEFVSGSLNREFCVKTTHQDFYIDTLAFDPEAKSFVIIEYKKDKNFSVIDQGYAYLAAMLNNKADFLLEYIERRGTVRKPDVDWRQSKVIFISPEFTSYQQSAIAFKDLPIELWKVALYVNNTVCYEQIKAPAAKGSFVGIAPKGPDTPSVTKQISPYTLEELFARHKTSRKTIDLFNKIRTEVSSLADDFDHAVGKWSVIYRKQYKTFAYLYPRSQEVYGELRLGEIKVPTKIGFRRHVQDKEIFKMAFKTDSENDLPDVLSLIRESYQKLSSELNT